MCVLVHAHACKFEHMRHIRGAHHELGLVCYNIQVAIGRDNAPDLQLINFY